MEATVFLLAELEFHPVAINAFKFPIKNVVRASVWFTNPRHSTPSEFQVIEPVEIATKVTININILNREFLDGQYFIGNNFYLLGYGKTIATGTILQVLEK